MRMSIGNLRAMLIRHEGLRLKVYQCRSGIWSIGVGRNLQDLGISDAEAQILLSNDITRIMQEAIDQCPGFKNLDIPRQDAILDMLFNLGLTRFLQFKNMLSAITYGNYNKAADEMLNSQWAIQVGPRATELAYIIRTGNYPVI